LAAGEQRSDRASVRMADMRMARDYSRQAVHDHLAAKE
jgi:hypothetical protein